MNPAFVFALLLISWSSSAAQPSSEEVYSSHAKNVGWDFAQWCQVGGHRFTFEKTTLREIAEALGGGNIVTDNNSGAAVYEWLLRYKWGNQVVIFASNSDMGGPTHDLEEVDVATSSDDRASQQLPSLKNDIRFSFGFPTMSFAELGGALGKGRLEGDQAEFQHLGHLPSHGYDGKPILMDVTSWLKVEVVRGRVTEIQISRVTSN